MCVVFVRPTEAEFSDRNTSNKLYAIVFETIKEIQIELAEAYPKNIGISQEFEGTIEDIVHESFILINHKLHKTFQDLEDHELKQYAVAILDPLWMVSLPFIPDALLCFSKLQDKRQRHNKENSDEIWPIR